MFYIMIYDFFVKKKKDSGELKDFLFVINKFKNRIY